MGPRVQPKSERVMMLVRCVWQAMSRGFSSYSLWSSITMSSPVLLILFPPSVLCLPNSTVGSEGPSCSSHGDSNRNSSHPAGYPEPWP